MDHKQQPSLHQPQQLADQPQIPLLHLLPHQEQILRSIMQATLQQLIQLRFNEPEHDQLHMRQHAAVTGAVEQLEMILTFDARQKAEFEAKMREAEQNAGMQQQSISDGNF